MVIPDDDTCHNRAVEMSPQNGGLQIQTKLKSIKTISHQTQILTIDTTQQQLNTTTNYSKKLTLNQTMLRLKEYI